MTNLAVQCYLNLGVCHFKLKNAAEVVVTCDDALNMLKPAIDPLLVAKAYYRKGLAFEQRGGLVAAEAAFRVAPQTTPDDRAVAALLQRASGNVVV